ncbi:MULTISPECIES: hypothetical protein [unclassified Streptomyces]|uniref:hypothetical protein n=1 Tax=unclassified Streptomyces TaxID=2593676 RepID=UPI00247497CD|nr:MULTISPECIES: hypothetical protein [unclassified Streptomyces]
MKVTNSTHDTVAGGITQQVVLCDAKGSMVGGDTGSSDNVPDNSPPDMNYREAWTGIPAVAKTVRAVYMVWSAEPSQRPSPTTGSYWTPGRREGDPRARVW